MALDLIEEQGRTAASVVDFRYRTDLEVGVGAEGVRQFADGINPLEPATQIIKGIVHQQVQAAHAPRNGTGPAMVAGACLL